MLLLWILFWSQTLSLVLFVRCMSFRLVRQSINQSTSCVAVTLHPLTDWLTGNKNRHTSASSTFPVLVFCQHAQLDVLELLAVSDLETFTGHILCHNQIVNGRLTPKSNGCICPVFPAGINTCRENAWLIDWPGVWLIDWLGLLVLRHVLPAFLSLTVFCGPNTGPWSAQNSPAFIFPCSKRRIDPQVIEPFIPPTAQCAPYDYIIRHFQLSRDGVQENTHFLVRSPENDNYRQFPTICTNRQRHRKRCFFSRRLHSQDLWRKKHLIDWLADLFQTSGILDSLQIPAIEWLICFTPSDPTLSIVFGTAKPSSWMSDPC